MSERRTKAQVKEALSEKVPDSDATLERWLAPTTESRVEQIAVEQIRDRAWRAEVDTTEPTYRALKASIRASGVLQPLLLRPHPDGGFEVVSGARRLAAARQTAQSTVPAVVRELTDVQALVGGSWDAVLRVGLSPAESRDLVAQLVAAGMEEGKALSLVGTAPVRADDDGAAAPDVAAETAVDTSPAAVVESPPAADAPTAVIDVDADAVGWPAPETDTAAFAPTTPPAALPVDPVVFSVPAADREAGTAVADTDATAPPAAEPDGAAAVAAPADAATAVTPEATVAAPVEPAAAEADVPRAAEAVAPEATVVAPAESTAPDTAAAAAAEPIAPEATAAAPTESAAEAPAAPPIAPAQPTPTSPVESAPPEEAPPAAAGAPAREAPIASPPEPAVANKAAAPAADVPLTEAAAPAAHAAPAESAPIAEAPAPEAPSESATETPAATAAKAPPEPAKAAQPEVTAAAATTAASEAAASAAPAVTPTESPAARPAVAPAAQPPKAPAKPTVEGPALETAVSRKEQAPATPSTDADVSAPAVRAPSPKVPAAPALEPSASTAPPVEPPVAPTAPVRPAAVATAAPHVIPIKLPDPAVAVPSEADADTAGSPPVAAPSAGRATTSGTRLMSEPVPAVSMEPSAPTLRQIPALPSVLRRGPLFYAVLGIGLAVGAIVFILVTVVEGVGNSTTPIIAAVIVAVLGFVSAMVSLAQPRERR